MRGLLSRALDNIMRLHTSIYANHKLNTNPTLERIRIAFIGNGSTHFLSQFKAIREVSIETLKLFTCIPQPLSIIWVWPSHKTDIIRGAGSLRFIYIIRFYMYEKKNNLKYRKISNIRRTKYKNLNKSRLILQSPLPNPLKPSVKSRMKM